MDNLVEEKTEKGGALLAEGKIEESEKCFLEIVKHDSKKGKAEAFNNLGVIALQRRNIEQACTHFMKALEIDPFNKYAILNYSQVLRVQDRLHIAIPILEKVVEKHPNDEEIGQLLVEGKTAALKQLAQKGINQGVYERVGLLMITKNHLATLKQNLPGLFDNTLIPYELTIIDNNSNDGTVKWLKEVKNGLPIDLHVIFSETDKSMFELSNAFFEQSECRYLVRVSPEAEFHPGWLMELYNRYHKFAAPGEKCWLSRDAEAVHKSLKLDDALHLENRHDYSLFYEEQGSDIGVTRFGQDRMFCPDGNPRLNYVFDCAEGNCLDVGCQYCAYTINLARRGLDVHAIDISASYINEARNRLAKELESVRKRVKLLQAWAEELPFKKCMFQTVLLSELLEHVIEPEKVVKEALRVLEPGGVIYISVPGYADNTLEHVRVFSEESILDLLSEFKEELDLSSIKWYVKAPNDHYILCVRKKKKESGFAVKCINRRASILGNGSFPLISVHMIVWNQERYIAEAIESVLNQTYQNFELIIVDDGSTDNTTKIVESFKCDKIKYFYKEHSGVVPSRNLARDKCTGDFIAFLDSDDIYEPNILQVGIATILGNPNVDAVYSNLRIIGPDSNVTGHIWQYRNYEAQELAAALFEAGQNVIPFGSMMISKALSDRVGPFDRDFIVSFDSDYIARLAKHGKLKHIDLPLYRCRRHGSNISHFRTSTKERAKSTVLMLNKMLHIFSRQELFPEIQWQFLSPHASDAEFNYQVGKVFLGHCRRYYNRAYYHELLEEGQSYLQNCLAVDAAHKGAIDLLNETNSLFPVIHRQIERCLEPEEKRDPLPKSSLRILYLADCRSVHTQRYAHFFKERGHDVHVFDTSGRTNNLDGIKLHFPQQIQENGAKIAFEDQFIHNVFALNRVIDEIKPDILHGHYLTGWCWWGAFTGFQPYMITSWGTDIFLDTRNEFNRRFTEFCLRESPLITADSVDLMEATQKLRGSRNGVKYIPFGIDVESFRPGYDVSELAKKLGVNGSKVVLSPRQFKPPANIDIIIKAIPKVVSKISDVVFILKTYLTNGSSLNEYERYLHELVKELNVEDHVMFMDDVDFSEMPTIYNLADVMVTLRDTDGSACSMLECMACKTPIVASDIGSMREWIIDGENGRLVDQHDPNAVADAIIEILTDYEKRQKFEDANHSLVREKADYRKNWLEVEKLYYGVKRNNMQQPYASGLLGGDLSVAQENLKAGWRLIASHKLDEAKEAFLNIFRLGELTMQSHLKALIGLAKIEWKRGDTSKAKASYTGCLRLLQSFELDRRIDVKCR